jgi:predicted dienelactone hydrolase
MTIKVAQREVDVHLWYPADYRDYLDAPPTQYSSALYGADPKGLWDPLSWKVASSIAREGPAIAASAASYPVIVFSHGNSNAPIDYAFTLEDLASAGFVVAAPNHANNSQDDLLRDFANSQVAPDSPLFPVFPCLDGGPSPCARTVVPVSMADRARDIAATLAVLSDELGSRVDVSRVGIMGHSRGTVSALVAAGGSTAWGIPPDSRIQAVMGLAIGARAVTFNADIGRIVQPTLLISGSLDLTSPSSISQEAFNRLPPTTEKEHVTIIGAMHRTFDSTYCQQMQSSAAIAQGNSRALLDLQTAFRLLNDPAPPSGLPMDYCGFHPFRHPTDVRPLVEQMTGVAVTPASVPTTGLTSDQLRSCVAEMAISFFEHTIGSPGLRPHHFRDDLPIERGPDPGDGNRQVAGQCGGTS